MPGEDLGLDCYGGHDAKPSRDNAQHVPVPMIPVDLNQDSPDQPQARNRRTPRIFEET